MTRKTTSPFVRLQLDAEIRVLPIQKAIPRDVEVHLLFTACGSNLQHMRKIAWICHILGLVNGAVDALVRSFIDRRSRNDFL